MKWKEELAGLLRELTELTRVLKQALAEDLKKRR